MIQITDDYLAADVNDTSDIKQKETPPSGPLQNHNETTA